MLVHVCNTIYGKIIVFLDSHIIRLSAYVYIYSCQIIQKDFIESVELNR